MLGVDDHILNWVLNSNGSNVKKLCISLELFMIKYSSKLYMKEDILLIQ
jgi:hypothetical protein